MASCQRTQTTNVVSMFVGDEDGIQGVGRYVQLSETPFYLPRRKATVHQHSDLGSFDQMGIAPAAAAQGSESH